MKLILDDKLEQAWQGQDVFEVIQALQGDVIRDKDRRKTLRFPLGEKHYYIKIHDGVGWDEVIKQLLQFKKPVLGAENEWLAIQHLKKINIDTLTSVGFGERGTNPANKLSFLVTEELENTLSVAKFIESWKDNPPSLELKKAVIETIARIARRVHESGMNHRDMYVCHFLLDLDSLERFEETGHLKFYLVDLHRAQLRKKVPERWVIKDVASIYYSMMDAGVHRSDILRFMSAYSRYGLRYELTHNFNFWVKVQKRAKGFYKEFFGVDAPIGY